MTLHSRQKGFSSLIILFLVVIVGIGLVGWQVAKRQKTDTTVSTTSSSSPKTNLSKIPVINAASQELGKQFAVVSTNDATQIKARSVRLTLDKNGPFYMAPGYDYFVAPTNGSSLSVTYHLYDGVQNSDGKTISDILTSTLLSHKFQVINDPSKDLFQGQLSYSDGTYYCVILGSENVNPVELQCAALSIYPETAASYKPFVDAYLEGRKTDPTTVLGMGSLRITNSKTSGYRTASAGIGFKDSDGGAGASFYQKSGGAWKLFSAGQMAPSCEQYAADPDATAAFKGTDCMDMTGKSSTVQ